MRHTQDQDFTCIHCRQFVSGASIISGVNKRNHCPYCLWSRHVDLHAAGDRLAVCMSGMEPIGLTLKKTPKKYDQDARGELMLIHVCTGCGKTSINRIAADDDADTVFELFQGSLELDPQTVERLERDGIRALGAGDVETVRVQLFGCI